MKLDQKIYKGGVPHVVPDVLGQVQRIRITVKIRSQKKGNGQLTAPVPGEMRPVSFPGPCISFTEMRFCWRNSIRSCGTGWTISFV